jgi:hypothetical protein
VAEQRAQLQSAVMGLLIAFSIPPVWTALVMWRFAHSGEPVIGLAVVSWMLATVVGLISGFLLRRADYVYLFPILFTAPIVSISAYWILGEERNAWLAGVGAHGIATLMIYLKSGRLTR